MLRRPEGRRSRGRRRLLKVAALVAMLLAVFGLLQLNNQPGLGISIYGLVPIVLAVFWFGLPGGLAAAAAALGTFVVDQLLSPAPDFAGATLGWAIVNRGLLFFGVPVLVTVLLDRERRLTVQLEEQRAQLSELQALRAALTPSEVPPTPGLEVATAFVPAESDVAGDFFLVVDGPGGCTTVVVGDVVGHGLVAARSAAFVRATLATFAHFTGDPAELLRLADTALREGGPAAPSFVTAVCLVIEGSVIDGTPEPEVRWAAAGHPTPWSLDTGAPLGEGAAGPPLGVGLGELSLEVGRAPLGSGVLAFTDGLTEGRPSRRRPGDRVELYGEERARQLVREAHGGSAGDVVSALVSAVTAFAGGELADDLCLVAVRPA